jgi:hypothetical protein
MIGHINDMIERTHRLTGMSKQDKRGFIKGEIPLYAMGSILGLGVAGDQLWDR